MRRILRLIPLFAWLYAFPALAGVPCSLPFNLQNGTQADASQVMANYNAIISCLTNAAAAGANADITALNALTTPLTVAQGATPVYIGSTSSGTGPVIVATTTPTNFSLVVGKQVTFVVGQANVGPIQLNVAGTGNVNFYRRTQLGVVPMVGGELAVGSQATAWYDGTQYQLVSATPDMVGEIRDYAGATAPAGWAFIDGSCQLRATFPALFSLVGTTYDPTGSTCDVAHFALPDGRGRMLAGQDNMGTNGAANRITNAASSCTGTTIGGAGCGLQTHTLTLAEAPTGQITMTDPGHTHNLTVSDNTVSSNPAQQKYAGGGTVLSTVTGSATTGITLTDHAGGLAHPILNPIQIVTKIIKL